MPIHKLENTFCPRYRYKSFFLKYILDKKMVRRKMNCINRMVVEFRFCQNILLTIQGNRIKILGDKQRWRCVNDDRCREIL